jgi:hypothetical protein
LPTEVFAQFQRRDYFLKPQVGIWFGPTTPILKTADLIDNNLGAGMFFRYNTGFQPLKIGVESAYQYFSSRGVNRLHFVPVYGNCVYLLPLNLPVRIQAKAGVGGAWMKIKPDDESRWNPIMNAGVEFSFPAGRIVNIGLRIDHFYIYEGYLKNSIMNGNIINSGIQVFININI